MKTLISTIMFWCLPIIESVASPLKLELYSQSRVESLIDFIIKEQRIQSHSIRFLTQESKETVDIWLRRLGKSRPLIVGNIKSNETGKPVIVIFLLGGNKAISTLIDYVLHWLSFSNRKNDRFILIANKPTLSKLWRVYKINQLTHRWGYTIDSNELSCRIEGRPTEDGYFGEISQFPKTHYRIGSNIRGRHLKVTGWAHVPPYHFILGKDLNGKPQYDGSCVRLFHEASLLFNFSYELHSDDEASSYGILMENGSWTGMIGDVNSGNYDVSLFIGPTFIWFPMFDFAGSLSGAAVRFLTPRPISELQWQAFLHPFRLNLWLALITLFFVVLSIILILNTLTKSKFSMKFKNSLQVVASTTLTLQIAIEQSARIPKGVRMVCGAWLMFSIIIGTAYKSQVMSSLTFPFTPKLPSTYQEIAVHKEYTSILNNIGGLEVSYFKSNDSEIINMIAKTMVYEPIPLNCIEKAVVLPKTVCIGWVPFLEYTVAEYASPDTEVMPIYISGDSLMPTTVSVAFQKNSPYTHGFTAIINSFWESGIYSLWERDVLRIHKHRGFLNYKENPNTAMNIRLKSIIDDLTSGNVIKPLKPSNLKMIFVVLTFGVCLGVSIFAIEQILNLLWKASSVLRNTKIIIVRSDSQ